MFVKFREYSFFTDKFNNLKLYIAFNVLEAFQSFNDIKENVIV